MSCALKKKLVVTVLSLSVLVLVCCALLLYTPTTALQPREVWRNDTFHWLDGDSSWIAGNMLLIGGYLVYVLANYKALVALDTATGQTRWKQDIREMGIYSLQDAIAENRLYAIDRDQNLVALNSSDGQVIWKQPLGLSEDDNVWLEYRAGRVFTKIMLASGGAKMISFKADSGENISEIAERTVALTVVAGDTLVSNNADSQQEEALYLTGFDIPSGQQLWEEQLKLRPYYNNEMKPPVVKGDEVYLNIKTARAGGLFMGGRGYFVRQLQAFHAASD